MSVAICTYQPRRDFLISELSQLNTLLKNIKPHSRQAAALAAWLIAIHDHFMSIWTYVSSETQAWVNQIPSHEISPKLRRMAIARLAEYL